MQPNIEEKRIETYRNAPEAIRELYVSDELTQLIDKVHLTFRITHPFKMLSEIVGDTILGFNKIADMPRLFQQKLGVSADESQRMTSQLIEILGPVVTREEAETSVKKEELSKLKEVFAQPEGIVTRQNDDQARVQTQTDEVEPIRTMAQDMHRVHGYGAYRAQEGEEGSETIAQSSQEEITRRNDSGQ